MKKIKDEGPPPKGAELFGSPWDGNVPEKVYFSSANFNESPSFIPQLQNRANHLPQLFKPCILPPWSGFEGGFAIMNNGLLQ
jgi:hypothetical protein